jgi:hypothetical protein
VKTTSKARRRLRGRAALAAGSAVAAGAVLALTALAATSAAAKPAAPAAQSYHISMVTSETFTPQYGSQHVVTMRTLGEFNPARHVGEETLPLNPELPYITALRYIGQYIYGYFPVPQPGPSGTNGEHWLKYLLQPPSGNTISNLPVNVVTGLVTPQRLLSELRLLTTVHRAGPASGPGWRGTRYVFSLPFNNGYTGTVHGTLFVDHQGRAGQLVLLMVLQAQDASASGIKSITFDITFSDFGGRVLVSAPPASHVYAPANTYFTYPLYYAGPPTG